ncbi:MAG TPA: NFACT RNA binding domain-containing protein, partial [Bacillota bacterium]
EDRAALAEIKAELAGAGYLKPDPPAGPRAKKPGKKPLKGRRPSGEGGAEPTSTPHRFLTTTGKEILVGRNNRQNDLLTLRLARPDDLWLHVKDIPGSHVILRLAPGEEAKPEEITEAALLAAWFSRGRQSSRVPVDYTTKNRVRKPSGARPGMVIYDHHHTVFVNPEPAQVERLKPASVRPSEPPSDG